MPRGPVPPATRSRETVERELAEVRPRVIAAVRHACPRWLADHAEDIAQNALLRIARILQQRPETDPPLPASYVSKAAYSAAVDAVRHYRRQMETERPMSLLDAHPGRPCAAEPPRQEADGSREAITLGLAALSRDRRRAVTLHLQGHRADEVARLLGWTPARARNLVYRGLADLRRELRQLGVEA